MSLPGFRNCQISFSYLYTTLLHEKLIQIRPVNFDDKYSESISYRGRFAPHLDVGHLSFSLFFFGHHQSVNLV